MYKGNPCAMASSHIIEVHHAHAMLDEWCYGWKDEFYQEPVESAELRSAFDLALEGGEFRIQSQESLFPSVLTTDLLTWAQKNGYVIHPYAERMLNAEPPDWARWVTQIAWSVREAIALILKRDAPPEINEVHVGTEPDVWVDTNGDIGSRYDHLKHAGTPSRTDEDFLYEDVMDAIEVGTLPAAKVHGMLSVTPTDFLVWCKDMGLEIPEPLRCLQKPAPGGEVESPAKAPDTSQWLKVKDAAQRYYDKLDGHLTELTLGAAKTMISRRCTDGTIKHDGEGVARRVCPDSLDAFILKVRDKPLAED